MPEFEVKVDALDVILALRDLAERASTLAPVAPELADAARAAFAASLETVGEYGNAHWAPLNERTMERYERGRWGGTLADHTGRMWESLTQRGAPGAWEELSEGGAALRVGTTDPAAGWFALGTCRQPARPFFGDEPPADLVDRVAEIVARHIAGPFGD